MPGRIKWDDIGDRLYETGVDQGVLFPKTLTGSAITTLNGGYATGVAWNGLTNVSENPSGAEANPIYADNIKYLNLVSKEEFGCTIECYTYPDEFAVCNGEEILKSSGSSPVDLGVRFGQQTRKEFGFCYRTKIGNDVDGDAHGYKLHIVYGCLAAPSSKDYSTVNDTPEAINFSYEVSTTPVEVTGHSPLATIVIDSTKADSTCLTALETILYGKDAEGESGTAVDPRLPMPAEVITTMTPAT